MVAEAEERARAAEDRAKEIEQRAEGRRVESERVAVETVEKARALSEKTVTEARAEANRLLGEARTEAELTTQAARREVEDLTRQKDAVTNQLGQMLSGLSGLVPSVGAAAKAAVENAQKDPKAEAPAQRVPEVGNAGAADKPVAAKTNS
jgi:hypothetical protein